MLSPSSTESCPEKKVYNAIEMLALEFLVFCLRNTFFCVTVVPEYDEGNTLPFLLAA